MNLGTKEFALAHSLNMVCPSKEVMAAGAEGGLSQRIQSGSRDECFCSACFFFLSSLETQTIE